MLYVSLASISTLGNNEIPVTFLARQFAAIEAITGQLYLAVLNRQTGRIQYRRRFRLKPE
jgi:hypothetical protein